jgi:hypothetical protein
MKKPNQNVNTIFHYITVHTACCKRRRGEEGKRVYKKGTYFKAVAF